MEHLLQNKVGTITLTDSLIKQTISLITKFARDTNVKLNELKISQMNNKDQNNIFHLNVSLNNKDKSISSINAFTNYISKKIEINLQILNPIVVVQLS